MSLVAIGLLCRAWEFDRTTPQFRPERVYEALEAAPIGEGKAWTRGVHPTLYFTIVI